MAIGQLNQDLGDGPILTDDQLANVRVGDVIAVFLRSDVTDQTVELLTRRLPAYLQQIDSWQTKPLEINRLSTDDDLLHSAHMAHLGAQLFGRHLISVELTGTLLLVALVGAIAIVIQGRNNDSEEEEQTTS
jgi:hypothetical protein